MCKYFNARSCLRSLITLHRVPRHCKAHAFPPDIEPSSMAKTRQFPLPQKMKYQEIVELQLDTFKSLKLSSFQERKSASCEFWKLVITTKILHSQKSKKNFNYSTVIVKFWRNIRHSRSQKDAVDSDNSPVNPKRFPSAEKSCVRPTLLVVNRLTAFQRMLPVHLASIALRHLRGSHP